MPIDLNEDEVYVGLINDEHIILLPGDNGDATWEAQMKWAKSIGGDLPSRIEQSMLWANHRDQFQKDWYWSNETHHSKSGWAWSQSFGYGHRGIYVRRLELRARAVRRVAVSRDSSGYAYALTSISTMPIGINPLAEAQRMRAIARHALNGGNSQ